LKEYPIDKDYFGECKNRVTLARKINLAEYQQNKEKSNSNWYEKNAKLLDIDMDDNLKKETYIDNDKARAQKKQLNSMKMQLNNDLKKMIFPKFFNQSYLHNENIERIQSMNSKLFYIFF
jgi:hypothetical protein